MEYSKRLHPAPGCESGKLSGEPGPQTAAKTVVHTESSTGWGGQEIRILAELEGLPNYGYNTLLVAPENSPIYQTALKKGIRVQTAAFENRFDVSTLIHLTRLFKRLKPAVLNTHSSIDAWIGGIAARIAKVPLIIRTRHVSTPIGSSFSYKYLADGILTTSESIRSHLTQKGVNPSKIITAPTGIDIEKFVRENGERKKIREKYGVRDEEILVGNLCILRSWKGVDFFIETAEAAPKQFKFMIVGDGPQRKRLERKTADRGLRERVIFTGYQECPERFLGAMDIFFFTSYASEGVSQALLQALCVGLPIVARKTPSIEEVLRKAEGVSMLNRPDVKAAKETIEAMALASFGKDAFWQQRAVDRKRLLSRYSLQRMLESLPSIYAYLAAESRLPDPSP